MQDLPYVLAITGASGAAYGRRLLNVLLEAGKEVHLSISPAGALVARAELGVELDLKNFDPGALVDGSAERLHYWHHEDFGAGIASGSFRTAGMAITPCSMGTLAAIAHGLSGNLIHRAAEVHFKERRTLVLTPRETPLTLTAIENMAAVTRAGAIVLPATPGFYHRPNSIADLVDFIVARVCDHLGVENSLVPQWGTNEKA